MTEQYAWRLGNLRAQRLGWTDTDHQTRVLALPAGGIYSLDANDALYFLLGEPDQVRVSAAQGYYFPSDAATTEQDEVFTGGTLLVENRASGKQLIRFLVFYPRTS